jgi:hypothetical protein
VVVGDPVSGVEDAVAPGAARSAPLEQALANRISTPLRSEAGRIVELEMHM